MNTNKRLFDILKSQNTKEISIDFDSRFFLFSDSHRGDGTKSDDFKHNKNIFKKALNHYKDNGFSLIELGDGDELWKNKSFQKILTANQEIFDLLKKLNKKNRFFIIWGNHNNIYKNSFFVKSNLDRFYKKEIAVQEGIILNPKWIDRKILLTHGHQGQLMNDILWPITRFFIRNIWKKIQTIGIHDPTTHIAGNTKGRKLTERKLKRWANKNNQCLICGHTHRPYFPSQKDPLYFNTGSCIHPHSITGVEIDRGKIGLVKWFRNEETNEIKKEFIGGPKKLDSILK